MHFSLIKPPNWVISGLVLGIVALAAHAVALVTGHILDNIDLRTHYQWAEQFSKVLGEGTFYPRWMPLANGGLGEPSFVIIHPGYYYFMALLKSLGMNLWLGMRVAAVISTFLVGIVTFQLLHKRLTYRCALFTAILLQTLPFSGFLFGFHAALPWQFSFPLAVLVIGRSTIEDKRRIDLLLAVSIALLCATHLLVAFMVLLSLTVYKGLGTVFHARTNLYAALVPWVSSVTLGLGLSAVYWLLAATSGSLFSVESRIDKHYLDWHNSFVFPFVTSGIFGTRWAVIQWVLPIIPLVFLLVTAWALTTQRNERSEIWQAALRLWIVGAFALLISSELAYPLYNSIPFLRNVQFPYRFLSVSSIAAALAFAMVTTAAFRVSGTGTVRLRLAIIGGVLISVILFLTIQYKQYTDGVPPGLGPATMAGHVGARGAEPASIGSSWKQYVKEGAFDGYCRRTGLECETKLNHSHHRVWIISTDSSRAILLPLFAFPAWTVMVDNEPAETMIDISTGLLTVGLTSGTHTVMVNWSLLWQERVGLTLSALSLVICALILLVRRCRPVVKD